MRTLAGLSAAIILALVSLPVPGRARGAVSYHDGLASVRADRAADPTAVAACERLASQFGTPLYVYDRATIASQFALVRDAFRGAFPKLRIFYAVKANSNPAIVGLLHREGAQPRRAVDGRPDVVVLIA